MILLKNTAADPPPDAPRRKIIDTGFIILACFTIGAGIAVWWLKGAGRLAEITAETMGFLAVLSPKILAGVFIAATVPLILPKEKVRSWIGRESGLRGLAIAGGLGAVVPGGPMMIFLLAAGIGTAGADMGAITAFVSGWALLSLNRTLIWELSFLPVDLVALRVALCLPIPVVIGVMARAITEMRRS